MVSQFWSLIFIVCLLFFVTNVLGNNQKIEKKKHEVYEKQQGIIKTQSEITFEKMEGNTEKTV